MPETVGLTGLQISILEKVWQRGEATTQDVWSAIRSDRSIALTTVATVMSRLERKRVLAHRREGRQYVYHATVSRQDVRRSKVRELTESLFGGDTAALVNHLVDAEGVDEEELGRIRDLLADRLDSEGAVNGEDPGG